MNQDIQLLLDALNVYSPTMKEGRLSRMLQERMRGLGFRNVRTDSAGNAIGEVGKGRPHLLLCGHMDTVPGRIPVREEGDRVYGRGATDAKSPMCAMISAAAAHRDGPVHITMACVTREEGDSLGIHTLIDSGGDYDAAVFGEPGGAHRVAVGYRGRVEVTLTVATSGGHAASSWAHQSAVDQALALLSKLKAYEKGRSSGEDHYRSLNISLTMIRGGSFSNVIPRSCKLTLDVRLPPGTSSDSVESDLRAMVEEHSRLSPGANFNLEFAEPTEAYEAPTDSVVVRSFQRSILTNLRTKPAFTHKTGTGDMNTLAERMKIPCVTYGPGDSRLEHTDNEYVEISDYQNSVSVLRGVFREFRSLSTAR